MNENPDAILPARQSREPDFCLGGFELWIHGRSSPASEDYWDGNWLLVTARCSAHSAIIETGGSILHLSELETVLAECRKIYASLSGEARLDCLEPGIRLRIVMGNGGHCELFVSITPDHLYQDHSFTFDLDQSYLAPFIKQLERVFATYPLKG